MFLFLVFLLTACSFIQTIPIEHSVTPVNGTTIFTEDAHAQAVITNDENGNFLISFTSKSTQISPIPLSIELTYKKSELTNDKTTFMPEMTSTEPFEEKNNKNRLLKISNLCGLKRYFQLISNGHHIFYRNIYDPAFHIPRNITQIERMNKETLCIRALISNIDDIGEMLTELNIVLPSVNVKNTPELQSATNSYITALNTLVEKKTNFQKVSVYSGDVFINENIMLYMLKEEFFRQEVETKIFNLLSRLEVDFLDIKFKVRNPSSFSNPSVKKLSAHQLFTKLDNYPKLLNLNSVVFLEFEWSRGVENRVDLLRIAKSHGVKELTIPFDLVPEALSDQFCVERLNILGSHQILTNIEYFRPLIQTKKQVTALKLGINVYPTIAIMVTILDKFKLSLTSLALWFRTNNYLEWEALLCTFLFENFKLNELEVSLRDNSDDIPLRHLFLEHAVNLTSYSFVGKMVLGANLQQLLDFVATHKSLKNLSLKLLNEVSEDNFMAFYETLVSAIQSNPSIEHFNLIANVHVLNLSASALLFSEKTKPLIGRGLFMNSLPVDNIVNNLASGLENGLRWNTRSDNSAPFILRFE